MVAGSGNLTLAADVTGEYTFVWTFATNTLTVTFPEKGVDPDPQPSVKFYITGNAALVGEEKAWKADAVAVSEDSYTFKALAAGDYQLKVTLKGAWNPAEDVKGFDALTEKAEGLTKDESGNICFTLSEAGDVKVTYTGEVFKLEGKFYVKPVDPQPEVAYYLVGNMTDWKVVADPPHRFAVNKDNESEMKLQFNLAEGDEFKVVKMEGEKQTWYPEGENNNYVVDAAHAGACTIYFRADAQGGEDWHYGCIYVAAPETTAIGNTEDGIKAEKVIMNGQFFILKGNKVYTITGQTVR